MLNAQRAFSIQAVATGRIWEVRMLGELRQAEDMVECIPIWCSGITGESRTERTYIHMEGASGTVRT